MRALCDRFALVQGNDRVIFIKKSRGVHRPQKVKVPIYPSDTPVTVFGLDAVGFRWFPLISVDFR